MATSNPSGEYRQSFELSSVVTSPLSALMEITNRSINLASSTFVSVGSAAVAATPAVRLIEAAIIRQLSKEIRVGELKFILPNGVEHTFGPGDEANDVVDDDKEEISQELNLSSTANTTLSSIPITASSAVSSSSATPRYQNSSSSISTNSTSENGHSFSFSNGSHPSTPNTLYSNVVSGSGTPTEKKSHTLTDQEQSFKSRKTVPKATVRILSPNFYLRLLLSGDLGFAESYMAGEVLIESSSGGQRLKESYYGREVSGGGDVANVKEREGEGLLDLFQIAIQSSHPARGSSLEYSRKREAVSGFQFSYQSLPGAIISTLGSWTTNSRLVNSVRNSVGNIRAHYDISNRMFASFLSPDMTYSSAIFPTLDGDLDDEETALEDFAPPQRQWSSKISSSSQSTAELDSDEVDELEEAQYAKLRHIIRKAKIRAGHRVLEIGSGWGSFAIEAVRMTGCTVDTLTLSEQQKVLAEDRIRNAGLQDSITVHLMDFRSLPQSWYHTFDRLVSIEMLEAVGKEYIEPYFKMIDDALNENGVACFQVITIPESRFETYANSNDFIRKWIFPGGFLPSVSYTTECIQKGAKNRLVIDSICNIGPHYARTLREWRIRFLKNFERDIIPALRDEHPEMNDEDIQVFKRKWIYYFAYCEIGFSERVIGDHIFCLTREGNVSFGSDVFV